MATHQSKILLTSAFLLGIVSVLFVDLINFISHDLFIDTNEFVAINDFLFAFFGVSCVEEVAKFIPFAILFALFPKRFNDPVDYILFAAFSAIGFACFENLRYFNEHGFFVLAVRSVTAMPSHIIFSCIFIYGLIEFRFRNQSKVKFSIVAYMFLAIMTHATYDFILTSSLPLKYLIVVVLFFFMISVFMAMVENSLNNSKHFSINRYINSKKLTEFLILNYALLLLFTLVFFSLTKHKSIEIVNYLASLIWKDGFIMFVLTLRIARFKIIPKRWNPIRPEMPFSVSFRREKGDPFTLLNYRKFLSPSIIKIKIKGETYAETYLNYFIEKNVLVQPVSARRSFLKNRYKGILDLKLFLKNDEAIYLIILFTENGTEYFYMKPKSEGLQRFGKRPIVALMRGPHLSELNENNDSEDFTFLEWVVLKA